MSGKGVPYCVERKVRIYSFVYSVELEVKVCVIWKIVRVLCPTRIGRLHGKKRPRHTKQALGLCETQVHRRE